MPLRKLTVVLITMFALFGWSCKSPKVAVEKETLQSQQVQDSVSEKITSEIKLIITPKTKAQQNLSLEQLQDLPIGGKYQAQDGNATGTIEKKPDGSLEFTANCDSLNILIKQLTTEVYRYKNENAELKTTTSQTQIVEVNVISGWQWFQIWMGRICLVIITIYILYRKFK